MIFKKYLIKCLYKLNDKHAIYNLCLLSHTRQSHSKIIKQIYSNNRKAKRINNGL